MRTFLALIRPLDRASGAIAHGVQVPVVFCRIRPDPAALFVWSRDGRIMSGGQGLPDVLDEFLGDGDGIPRPVDSLSAGRERRGRPAHLFRRRDACLAGRDASLWGRFGCLPSALRGAADRTRRRSVPCRVPRGRARRRAGPAARGANFDSNVQPAFGLPGARPAAFTRVMAFRHWHSRRGAPD